PNPSNPSLVTQNNNWTNIIQTPQGHSLVMVDNLRQKSRETRLTSSQGHSLSMKDDLDKRELMLSSANNNNYVRIIQKK
ncbi:MAG: hypothetical protein LBP61_10100, partial [Desulfovibrio sp.]|nr:hypothetical protein [Desulfovibrio sp.]